LTKTGYNRYISPDITTDLSLKAELSTTPNPIDIIIIADQPGEFK